MMKRLTIILLLLCGSAGAQTWCPPGLVDSCHCSTYNDAYDTSLVDADTVRMVVHVFGATDSTNWTEDSITIDSAVDWMNYTWAAAKLYWVYSINWIPNTQWRTTHALTDPVNPNQVANNTIRPLVMLAPDSQMQVYVAAGLPAWGQPSTTTGEGQYLFLSDFGGSEYQAPSHEGGHVFGLKHTHEGVGYSGGGSWPACAGASAEVSSLADSTTEARAKDSSRYVNGDYCKDTKADPGFDADSLPNISVDSCTGLAWGLTTTDALNVMSYTCPGCMQVMTADQARVVRCWLETNYPGWIRHE